MTTHRRSRPIRVISASRPTPEQAQAMIRNAAPQIAALLDWAERQKQKETA